MSKNNFEWVKFYKEFAKKLCHFKYMRDKLIEKIVDIYKNIDIKMPTLELKNDLVDIDPFTVFGLFNKTSMKEENRIKIINAFAKSFDIKSKVPTSFNSIPVLNNQNATFYYFVDDRNDRDIDDLWDFFESALNYSEEQSDENKNEFSKWFNIVINKKGNGNGKITMGLFWINPDLYFNLDSRNVWFVYESGKLPKELVNSLPKVEKKISAESYFEIADIIKKHLDSGDLPFKDFKELSYEAWRYSTEVNENNKEDKKISNRNTKNTTLLDDADTIHYWLYAPGRNAVKWDEFYNEGIMAIGWDEIGDLSNYDTQSQMIKAMKNSYDPNRSYKNNSYATWQFANEMKPGDIVFAKKGLHQIVGYGIVDSDYMFNDSRNEYKNIRKVNWIHKGEWEHPGQAVLKTLTDITPYTEYVENLIELVKGDSDDESDEMEVSYSIYNKEMFLADVYISEKEYNTICELLMNKKNIVLQGPPGVGKTFSAKRLAYSIIGESNPTRVSMVQFHQSYSYEDFIMGFRPTETGFKLHKGAFYDFCKTAEEDSENDYFFIIDEINRGNLSKIFGELFMLIESDKRGISLQLLYSNEKFSVPKNLYIIGMMNTADRSLAMLDYALRRRFAFFEVNPSFESEGFIKYKKSLNSDAFDNLIYTITDLNKEIHEDESLGEGFAIGHSYFCNLKEADEETLRRIIDFEIIPLLKEYWFDDKSKIRIWSERLRSAIK